jgi:hypothetical protein
MAQAMASGFENLKPAPQAKVSQAHGLALAWPILLGLVWLLASGPSQHITIWIEHVLQTCVHTNVHNHKHKAYDSMSFYGLAIQVIGHVNYT